MKVKEYRFDYETNSKLPTIQFCDRIFTVNSRMSNQEKIKDIFKNVEETRQDYEVFKTVLGKEAADYIQEKDMPVDGVLALMKMVMAAIQGITVEELEKEEKKGSFRK